jgi:predicted lipoprotein with Yx(FWY)xxD motif
MTTHHSTPQKAVVAMAMLLLLGLAACGDDNNDSSTASGGQSATTAAAPVTTAAATATTAPAAVLKTANSGQFGTILVDATGKSLYTFDRDTSPTSACTGNCAVTWPPLLLPAGASGTSVPATGVTGKLAVSPRPDGGSQITLNDKPLYRYSGDANAGDVNGDGVGGIWHIAKAA